MLDSELLQLRRLAEKELKVPTNLHDYQWDGAAFLYRSEAALLADEMGLGKTVQTVVALALLLNAQRDINRVIIVAPASLTINWMREISMWGPSITARRVTGDARSREAYYLLPIPVLVASYEQIRFDSLDRIPPESFDLVILDEAQRIKNKDSATSFACRLLPRRRAWALSATPLENSESDLASLMSFLSPGRASRSARLEMARRLEGMMLRRRKRDVRAELPPVLIQDLELELSEIQRSSYDELYFERRSELAARDSDDAAAALLALITRLKIICNYDAASGTSSKFDALQSIIESAGASARIIVFSQFVETLKWLSKRITSAHDLITGSMSLEARDAAIARFSEDPSPRVLLISLRAGGVGLNIGKATHVVLFDRWWNPAVEVQAIYRAHRFDRADPLHVIRFLVQDTVEERIAEILARKARLFDEVVESVEPGEHRFTRDELLQILDLTPDDLAQMICHTKVEEVSTNG